MKKSVLVRIGQRPTQRMVVTTRDGKRYDLGLQVAGDDWVAKFFQWRQRRKIRAYCKDRLRNLTGVERQEFIREMEAQRG